jgi:hypothetical protein
LILLTFRRRCFLSLGKNSTIKIATEIKYPIPQQLRSVSPKGFTISREEVATGSYSELLGAKQV